MKMAFLGAGSIAVKMANTLLGMDEITRYAVGARDLERAEAFCAKFGFQKAYGSYEALVSDPEIDLVYIATPHSHHYEHIKLCLAHNKHVLCEKAFTVNAAQAKEVIAIAEKKGLLLTEAIWTRYMPMRKTIMEIINSGVIGEITSLSCNLGYTIDHVKRIQEPALAGGALLDLSVYVLNFASMFFGDDIQRIVSMPIMTEKGVDSQEAILITYPDGKLATMYTTTMAVTDREGVINGRKGHIKIQNINNYECVRVYNERYELIQTIQAPPQISGYEYEVRAAKRAIEEGKTECEEMPHRQTILMMEVMDGIRAQWGMRYPCE